MSLTKMEDAGEALKMGWQTKSPWPFFFFK